MAETKKNKVLIWMGIFLAFGIIGVLVYAFRDRIFGPACDPNNPGYTKKGKLSDKCAGKVDKPNEQYEPVPPGSTTTTGTPSNNWTEESFPLKKGMYGPKIKAVQTAWKIGADGKFGSITENTAQQKIGKTTIDKPDYDSIIAGASVTPPPSGGSPIGKVAYATQDEVPVYNGLTTSLYKKAKKNEWIGRVKSESGVYYLTEGGKAVDKQYVYLKNY